MSTVQSALRSRRTTRAFRPEPIGADVVMKVLEPALAAPSWANTQPWEIFVAAGAPLERIREGYAEMVRKGVPRNPDVAMPAQWPDACRARMEALKSGRFAAMAEACPDSRAIPDP